MTGSIAGIAASSTETWSLGSLPYSAAALENSFDLEETCACTSMPMMISQSPVAPLSQSLLSATRNSEFINLFSPFRGGSYWVNGLNSRELFGEDKVMMSEDEKAIHELVQTWKAAT